MDRLASLLSWVKNELLALKTASIRSSTQITTILKSVNVQFYFYKYINPYPPHKESAMSTKWARITVTPISNMPFLAQLTEDIDDLSSRRLDVIEGYNTTKDARVFYVECHGNDDDLKVIDAGGSASVSYTISVTATADFTMAIDYVDTDDI